MKLKEIIAAIEAENLAGEIDPDLNVTCAFGSDLISDILMCTKEPTLLLTGLTNPQIVRVSDMIDLFAIVFVRGKKPAADVIEMARERNLPLLSTKFTLYRTSGILYNLGLRSCMIS
jgi:predicted transcriptional regulator